jgi:hypothetical protein
LKFQSFAAVHDLNKSGLQKKNERTWKNGKKPDTDKKNWRSMLLSVLPELRSKVKNEYLESK